MNIKDNYSLHFDGRQLQSQSADYVARQIRHYRLELGLTQKDLAQHLGCTYQQIQKYETGKNRVHSETLFLMAKVFGVSVESFFPGHEVRTHPILERYFRLPEDKRDLVARLIKSFL